MGEARRPRFFKVLVGDFAHRVEIPQDFLCHIQEESRRTSEFTVAASAKVVLQNAEGKTWPVELEEINGRVFLATGWPKFVEGNCLGEGEFLVFKYDGNMHFMVLVFGMNAVEKSVWPSGSGAQATGNLEGKLSCDIFSSSKRGHDGDKLTEMAKSLTHSHSQTVTLQITQGDDAIGFLNLHKVGCSQDELEKYLSLNGSMEDDKAKAIAKVTRTLNVDKLAIDLFCATLSFHKWNVDAAAEDFYICRGKPHIPEQILKQKLVLQFNFVKEQLRHFFPLHDDSSAPIHERRKNKLEGPNLSNQPLQHDLTPVKRKLVDEYESCDLSHQQKRRLGKLLRGSPQTQTPRRSPRWAHLTNTCNSTNNTLKGRSEALEPSPALANQVKDRAYKSCLLHEKQDIVLKGVHEKIIGSLSQDSEPTCSKLGLREEHEHNQGEIIKKADQGNGEENKKGQTERNAAETFESFMSTVCTETEPLPTNSELSSYSRIDELSFTWKPSQHGNPIEKILHNIERDNFMTTISRVQKIIQDDPPDIQTADVIEAIVRTGILKWDSCLQDSNAQRIVNAFLEYAKKVKEKHNFNIEVRKEEFSAKLQDHSKWQLKELEMGYTSLELDYKKATADSSMCFSTLGDHTKKLHAIQDDIKDLQQALMMKEDEMQKMRHQVSEHEALYQKSIMEKVRVKTTLKSYQQILDEVKMWLASTEPGSVDVDALVKVEIDNMSKDIELSKGSLLNINFKKQ